MDETINPFKEWYRSQHHKLIVKFEKENKLNVDPIRCMYTLKSRKPKKKEKQMLEKTLYSSSEPKQIVITFSNGKQYHLKNVVGQKVSVTLVNGKSEKVVEIVFTPKDIERVEGDGFTMSDNQLLSKTVCIKVKDLKSVTLVQKTKDITLKTFK